MNWKKTYDWTRVCTVENLSEEFMDMWADELDWLAVSQNQQHMSIDFINKHADRINWGAASKFLKLDENTIAENHHRVNWQKISMYQPLSEAFMRDWRFHIDWDMIPVYQKNISEEFLQAFADKMKWHIVVYGQDITKERLEALGFSITD